MLFLNSSLIYAGPVFYNRTVTNERHNKTRQKINLWLFWSRFFIKLFLNEKASVILNWEIQNPRTTKCLLILPVIFLSCCSQYKLFHTTAKKNNSCSLQNIYFQLTSLQISQKLFSLNIEFKFNVKSMHTFNLRPNNVRWHLQIFCFVPQEVPNVKIVNFCVI